MSALIKQGFVSGNRIITCGLGSNAEAPPEPPVEPTTYSVTINASVNGSTTPTVGVHDYVEGTELTLTATAVDGYRFRHWQIGNAYYTANPFYYTVTADATITPIFQVVPTEETPTTSTPGALTFGTLFETVVYQFERRGVSCDVTLHSMQLGYEQQVHGQYTKEFSSSLVKMVIEPDGVALSDVGAGTHSQLHAKAKCKVNVVDGDEVTDGYGNVWTVTAAYPFTVGDVLTNYQVDLELKFGEGTGAVHPPATNRKRLWVHVIDGSREVVDTCALTVHVVDIHLVPSTRFPYDFAVYFTS